MRIKYLLILIIVSSVAFSLSCKRAINLLAVVPGEDVGTVARAYVEMIPGSGRVFIDTLPLTGEDTQASARMAKEAAENFMNSKISDYDILYTIRADSPSISGPSGGAGLAVLAVASYLCLPVNEGMAITGTINPDSTIGYVGGLKAKIKAAANSGIKYVVIPYGEKIGNETKDDVERELNITILEAETLDDAVRYFTGYEKPAEKMNNFTSFEMLMKKISEMMMNISLEMADGKWKNRTDEIIEYYNKGEYYTSSSLSFGLWVDIENEKNRNMTLEELNQSARELLEDMERFDTNATFDSYRDVEIYVVFQERMEDAITTANQSLELMEENLTEAIYKYSYAKQRFETAKIWKSMMDFFDDNISFNESSLQELSLRRLEMAQAMLTYVSSIVGGRFLGDASREYEKARQAYSDGKYALSISHSIKSMASSSLVLEMSSSLNLSTYAETKKRVVEKLLYYSPNPSFISWNYKQLADYYSDKSPMLAVIYYKYSILYSTFYQDIISHTSSEEEAHEQKAYEVKCKDYETDKRRIAAWVLVAWIVCVISSNIGKRISRIGKAGK